MRRLSAVAPILLLLAAGPAHAQGGRRVRPPRALVARLMRDMDDAEGYAGSPADSVAAGITVERRDLNGDGAPEYIVEETRYCGTNCGRRIYRRLPGGGYRGMLTDLASSLDVLPARVHGWHSISTWYHFSCCEGAETRYAYERGTYAWRDTRWQRERRSQDPVDTTLVTIYHLSITPPGGRRRLRLDPLTAANGVRIDAGYDVCRGEACGAPWLRLSSPRLPAGRVCVGMRAWLDGDRTPRRWSDCGVTAPGRAGGRATRTLVLHLSRGEWGSLVVESKLEMAIPGAPGAIGDDAEWAVRAFADGLADYYRVTCPPFHCPAPGER